MKTARITPCVIAGQMTPPPSKSAGHRALICCALSLYQKRQQGETGEPCKISRIWENSSSPLSEDLQATLGAIDHLGIAAEVEMDRILLSAREAFSSPEEPPTIDCRESGSTLRFLIPVFAALGLPAVFTGNGRLPHRPLTVFQECLPAHGVKLEFPENGDSLPLRLSGRLTGGLFDLPGNVSSQFISGLLLALPLCGQDSEIRITTPVESAGYIDMTVGMLSSCGIDVIVTDTGWKVPGNQQFTFKNASIEGDWSQAAFLLAAGALGGEVRIPGLRRNSAQGDRAALSLFRKFGAELLVSRGIIRCRKAPLTGMTIDASQIPDLVPILAVTAATARGDTHIVGAQRLRLKERDRLAAITDCLNRLGARVEEFPDSLLIHGIPSLKGGQVSGYNDHRIVMSMTMAALSCRNPVEITDADAVAKSWPGFFEDFRKIGGIVDVF